jgi:tRNA 2-selenouridine synthase
VARIQIVKATDLSDFDAILDVRSPAEFAEDHIPGAINVPVLNNDERARVGTLYKQVSPFAARKIGAALVARNIAIHLERHFLDMPKSWRPLIYCWRGGQRSGAMAHILGQIGWAAGQLEGGYKAYRHHVMEQLRTLPAKFEYRIICGPTGSGKSRFLKALAECDEQVLDLEGLACHRGSLLGNLPGESQPSQKLFESHLWEALCSFSPDHPVFIEAESRRIGMLDLPDSLLQTMRTGDCVCLEADREARIALLLEDYAHFTREPALLLEKLDQLTPLYGHKMLDGWRQLASAMNWQQLVSGLLELHYDPSYRKSTQAHYVRYGEACRLRLCRLDHGSLLEAARALLAANPMATP